MNATVQKWGNSMALRIPSGVAKELRLRKGSVVELEVRDGVVVVKPLAERRYSLSKLVKAIRAGNLHGEAFSGAPAGREAL